MSAPPLSGSWTAIPVGWVNANDLHHRRPTSGNAPDPGCAPTYRVTYGPSSQSKARRHRSSHSRSDRNSVLPREKNASITVGLQKPVLIVDPPLFPEEEPRGFHNCRQPPAQLLVVKAHVKQLENGTPTHPPPAPRPQRLPTPDLPELECGIFCGCCPTQNKKDIMVSRENNGRRRETMYFGMK